MCYSHHDSTGPLELDTELMTAYNSYDSWSVWAGALSMTLFISFVPYMILILFPLDNSIRYRSTLNICLSFASGGLLGDAFLHLIPESLANSGDNLKVGVHILSGFFIFLLIEKIVRAYEEYMRYKIWVQQQCNLVCTISPCQKMTEHYRSYVNGQPYDDRKISGYLNLVADFIHNFTDGLAIGASFLSGQSIGFITGIVVMVHEIPHEIGDFAILLRAGLSREKAMKLQFISAFGAFSGTILSLCIDGFDLIDNSRVLSFISGGFIYIATVSILSEFQKEPNPKESFNQLISFVCGTFLTALINLVNY